MPCHFCEQPAPSLQCTVCCALRVLLWRAFEEGGRGLPFQRTSGIIGGGGNRGDLIRLFIQQIFVQHLLCIWRPAASRLATWSPLACFLAFSKQAKTLRKSGGLVCYLESPITITRASMLLLLGPASFSLPRDKTLAM